jgi:hypothetical protein
MKSMQWFAVRTIFRHGQIAKGKGIFEEKIIAYRAADVDAALEMAKQDTTQYLDLNKEFVKVGRYEVFMLGHNEADLNSREVWSHLSEGPFDTDQFYRDKYEKFKPRDME